MRIEIHFDAQAVHDALTRAVTSPLVVHLVHDSDGVGLVIPGDDVGTAARLGPVDGSFSVREARLLADQGHYTEAISAAEVRVACEESLAQRAALVAQGVTRESPATIWVEGERTPMTRREMPGFVVRDIGAGTYLALDGDTAFLTHDLQTVAVFALPILAEPYLTPDRQIIRAGAVFPVARVR